jgi:hypothetical protein
MRWLLEKSKSPDNTCLEPLMPIDFSHMRLGRLPHDPVAVAAMPKHMAAARPLTFPKFDPASIKLLLGQNDILPTCTATALANSALVYAIDHQGTNTALLESKIPAFYADTIGQPGANLETLASTDGAVMLNVLNYQTANGFDIRPYPEKAFRLYALPTTIAPRDRATMAAAMETHTSLWCGFNLLLGDQAPGPKLDPRAGSQDPWGAHCAILMRPTGLADTDTLWWGTWAEYIEVSWAWVDDRLEEAYVLGWPQLGGVPADVLQSDPAYKAVA